MGQAGTDFVVKHIMIEAPPTATDVNPSLTWMDYQPLEYEALLATKVEGVRRQFAAHLARDAAELEVYASQPQHFRNRARFAIARFDGVLCFALFDKGAPTVAVRQFPIATKAINDLMPRLIDAINESATLAKALSAVHFLSPQSGDMLVTLIYAEAVPLDERWCDAAHALKAALGVPALLGRTKGQTVCLEREHVEEVYALKDGRRLKYRQMEGSFSNPSATMCEHTLGFLCEAATEAAAAYAAAHAGRAPALLELYCGNGNHTVALGRHFSRVLAVEIDRRLVDAAGYNLAANGVTNANVLCASSGKFCKRLYYHLRKVKQSLQTTKRDVPEAAVTSPAAEEVAVADSAPPAVPLAILTAMATKYDEAMLPAAAEALAQVADAAPPPSATAATDIRSPATAWSAPAILGSVPVENLELNLELQWLREAEQRTDVVLVDPPRCGLDADTLLLVGLFDHILYISCHPSSLLAALDGVLGTTHEVRRWAVFDHFAYTDHLEMGVLLSRRGCATRPGDVGVASRRVGESQ